MEDNNEVLYTSFSQNEDFNYFLIGTKEGCTIYQSKPFKRGFQLGNSNSKYLFMFIIR